MDQPLELSGTPTSGTRSQNELQTYSDYAHVKLCFLQFHFAFPGSALQSCGFQLMQYAFDLGLWVRGSER